METVTFPCPVCRKEMAAPTAALGARVRCPHCQQVVSAPAKPVPAPGPAAAAPAPASPPPPAPPTFEPMFFPAAPQEHESIFEPPEQTGDDLFGAPAPAPRLELPPEPPRLELPPAPTQILAPEPAPTRPPEPAPNTAAEPPPAPTDATQTFWTPAAGIPEPAPAPPPLAESSTTIAEPAPGEPAREYLEPAAPEAPATPVFVRKRSRQLQLAPLILIFLIPYAIVITIAFVYMLAIHRTIDPLEQMFDPNPKEGGARRVKHDSPLPEKLKTSLGKPITIGSLLVQPQRIELNPQGDLVLVMKMRNVSDDTVFNPFPDSFNRHRRETLDSPKPYTFLKVGAKSIYGGFPEWFKGAPGKERQVSVGDLSPGEEMVVKLVTAQEDRPLAKQAAASKEALLWRLHVRRGLVQFHGQPTSTTAVIGVRFTGKDVEVKNQPEDS